MKPSLAAAAGTVATVALIAGCSSSGGTPAKPAAKVSTAQASGTETINGQVTGAAAMATTGSVTFPLVLTGPVITTGTITVRGGTSHHFTLTFKTKAGDLVVAGVGPDIYDVLTPKVVNAAACRLRYTAHDTFAVTGTKSTGAFKDAHGSGKVTIPLEADAPKLSNGKCDMSNNDPLLAQGAIATFHSVGHLTVH